MLWRYWAMPIVARMTISVITTNSSIMVKPRVDRNLPVTVLGAIERGTLERGVDIEYILPAPPRGVGVVLVGTLPPFGVVGHRVDRHPPQELQLAAGRVVHDCDPFDERVEIGRIAFRADL